MKAVKIELAGRERYLFFSVDAMLRIGEDFGGAGGLLEAMEQPGKEGLAAACKAAALLAEQGELARRALGYEPTPCVRSEDISATLTPVNLPKLKTAVMHAVSLGFGREVLPENAEVDLGLAELEAQKKTA